MIEKFDDGYNSVLKYLEVLELYIRKNIIDTKFADAILISQEIIRNNIPQEIFDLNELKDFDGFPVKIVDNGIILYGIVSYAGNEFEKQPLITIGNGEYYKISEIATDGLKVFTIGKMG